MGCIFGYIGRPKQGLVSRMGKILAHRCPMGTEEVSLIINEKRCVEIGHGLASWQKGTQVFGDRENQLVFGHSGVFFLSETGQKHQKEQKHPAWIRFQQTGAKAVETLDGAWVFAGYFDENFYLGRDGAGIKALYWAKTPKRLLFASEIKALFADPDLSRNLRAGAVPEYLSFSFIPGANTMFENIFELEAGTTLREKKGDIRIHRHFVFETLEPANNSISMEKMASRFKEDFTASVENCIVAAKSQPAVFLSGGVDSSAVLAMTANLCKERIPTFSVHFGKPYANENEFISMMVEKYHTDHHYLEIKPKFFLKRMREIIWRLDDPIGDPITVPNFLMAEAAAGVTDLVFNGEGGDPCFGGPKNIPMIIAKTLGPYPGESEKTYLERNYLFSYRKCFGDLKNLLTPQAYSAGGGKKHLYSLLHPFFYGKHPSHFLNKLMAINIRLKGANLILVKVDKMTSSNGILALPPLFTRKMIQMSMECPPGFKLMGNVEKAVLKAALEDILPKPIIHRPKSGMMVPVRFWLKKEMRGFARKVLCEKRLKKTGLFNPAYVRTLLDYDKSEIMSARYGLKLWMLITFMLWYEQMVENKRPSG